MSDDGRHVFFGNGGPWSAATRESLSRWWAQYPGDYFPYGCFDGYDNFDGVTSLVTSGPTDPHSTVDYFLSGTSRDGRAFFKAAESLTSEDNAGTDIYQWFEGSLSVATVDAASTSTTFLAVSDDGDRMFYDDGSDIWEAASGPDLLRTPGTSGDTMCCDFRGGISGDGDHVYFSTLEALVPQDTDTATCTAQSCARHLRAHDRRLPTRDHRHRTTPDGARTRIPRARATLASGDKAYFSYARADFRSQGTDARGDLYEFESATGTTPPGIDRDRTGPGRRASG